MSTVLVSSEGNIESRMLKTSLFTFYDSHLVIKSNGEMTVFNLDEISNVRFSKKRNFAINIFLFIATILIYSFMYDFFTKNLSSKILLFIIFIVTSIISLSIKNNIYILFINLNYCSFKRLKLSKKEESYAEHLVSVFKDKNVNKESKRYDFVKFKYSS